MTRSRRGAARWGALVWLVVLALGCATPPTDDEVDAELRQIARSVKPPGELRVVGLYAQSRMDSWAQVAESTSEGRDSTSQPARRLIRAFSQADRRRISVVTGGPYASFNERTVLDAFGAFKSAQLRGLTLVYVSPEPPSDALRMATQKVGCQLVHRAPAER